MPIVQQVSISDIQIIEWDKFVSLFLKAGFKVWGLGDNWFGKNYNFRQILN